MKWERVLGKTDVGVIEYGDGEGRINAGGLSNEIEREEGAPASYQRRSRPILG